MNSNQNESTGQERMMPKYTTGQKITIRHPDYGSIQGTVHVLGNARPYVPLGFTHFTLGKRLEDAGWTIIDGWIGSPADRVLAVLDGWDIETDEPTQEALARAVRDALGYPDHTDGGER